VLEEAFSRCGMSQAALAAELEVSPGRVSQILNAETNLTLGTVARMLAAMGFDAVLSAVSMSDGSRIEPRVRIGRKDPSIDAYHQTYLSGSGLKPRVVLVPAGESPDAPAHGESVLIGAGSMSRLGETNWSISGSARFSPVMEIKA